MSQEQVGVVQAVGELARELSQAVVLVLVGQQHAGTAEHHADHEDAEDDASAEPFTGVRFLQISKY